MKTRIVAKILLLAIPALVLARPGNAQDDPESYRQYFVDSVAGDDTQSGSSENSAWQSLSRIDEAKFLPGDFIRFKRGSQFEGTLLIANSGSATQPIVLSDYGAAEAPPPSFTHSRFDPQAGEFGNCIRLRGSFIHVENLYFHHTVAELSGRIGFATMWELGAVYVERTARHCVVRGNEFVDCGVGIKSYGEFAVIRDNYIHDCNRILKEWSWGPIGIWLGGRSSGRQSQSHHQLLGRRSEN